MYRQDELLKNAVEKLSPQPIEAAIISIDGLSMASYSVYGNEEIRHEENRVGPISAAGLSLGERICKVLSHGEMLETIIFGTRGVFIMVSGGDWILSAKFSKLPELDDMRSQLQVVVEDLKPHFDRN